jgi:hypothetical protein
MQTDLDRTAKVEFFLDGEPRMYALRRLYHVPRAGDNCVLPEAARDTIRPVLSVTWCMDEGATERGVKVQVVLGDRISWR